MDILVTGGAGYIGSHTCLELLEAGHNVTVLDDLSNSKEESLNRVQSLTGRTLKFHQLSLLDETKLNVLVRQVNPDAVIHFAALKAVGESVQKPLEYYRNNVTGTLNLVDAMRAAGCKNLAYSSSCTVYGEPQQLPLTEEHPVGAAESPYGWTKIMSEQMLRDFQLSDPSFNIALLRYFNPVGAHASGRIGEDPAGIPNNLMPFISQVAVGKLEKLSVFGGDYDTRDGTCVRDYIHVVDLAKAHVLAVEKLSENPGVVTYNLGTGSGRTVLEVLDAFRRASGCEVPHQVVDRREGDIVAAYANASKAERELGWTAKLDIEDMCRDSWNWQQQNPDGL